MDFNDFGNDLEDSAELLIEKLKELHPWDEEWDLKTTLKLVPFYKEELEIIRINREIDLFNGPLIKLAIFRQDNDDELYIVMHHLLVDGISWRIISEDLNLVYAQLLHNGKISLPLKTSCYQDYALAIDKYASSEKLLEQKDYWDNVINQIKNSQYTKITSKRRMKRIDLKFSHNKSSVLLSNFSQWFDTSINAIFISAI